MLLDALHGVPVSASERASLTWLAGFETDIVENITAVNRTRPADDTALGRPMDAVDLV